MRQSQKSSRTRSRGRKPSNPLSRSYDSNGPDVKIRGTASHIAEKYQSLARDALASGDIVMAENCFQHAEHYLRIIAAAQPAQPAPRDRDEGRQTNGNGEQSNNERSARRNAPETVEINGDEPQPEVEGFESTAFEMEVAVIEDADTNQGSGEPVKANKEEDEQPPAPRRRRRTTYRSRKRPSDAEGGDEKSGSKSSSGSPEAASAED